jgi:hypothetical protein
MDALIVHRLEEAPARQDWRSRVLALIT